jgi:hypothetical protein
MLRVEINQEDDATRYLPELVRILRVAAQRIEQGEEEGSLRDINGITVGRFTVEGSNHANSEG